jgi:lysophospholipase L1-like esterase
MTAGKEGDYTWRYRLSQWFAREGISVLFVGPDTGTSNPDTVHAPLPASYPPLQVGQDSPYGPEWGKVFFNSNHAARWGKPFATAQDGIAALVQQYRPDIVLVALGFNDMGWYYSDDQGTLASLSNYIANARSVNPNLQFVVADVPQRSNLSWRTDLIAETTRYNAALPGFLANLETASSLIGLAPFNANYGCDPQATSCDSTYEGLHPNYKGDFRIAQAFITALHAKFGLGTNPSFPITGDSTRPLATPSRLTYDGTYEGVTVTWQRSYGATSYNILYRSCLNYNGSCAGYGFSTWSDWTSSITTFERWDLSWQFAGEPYTDHIYQVKVAACYGDQNSGVCTPYSDVVQGMPAPTVSGSPTGVAVYPIKSATDGKSGFIVNWNAPTGAYSDSIYEYDIWVYDLDTPKVFAKIYPFPASPTSAVVQNLKPGDHYNIVVEPWNRSGAGKPAVFGPVVAP